MSTFPSTMSILLLLCIKLVMCIKLVISHQIAYPRKATSSEKIFEDCTSDNDKNVFCFGTMSNGSKFEMSKKSDGNGCILLNTCTFLMVIEKNPVRSDVTWTGYVKTDGEKSSGRFQAVFRREKVRTSGCVPTKGSSDATWPSGTFLLEGNSGTAIQSLDGSDTSSIFVGGSTRRINDLGSGSDFNKFQWTSNYDPMDIKL